MSPEGDEHEAREEIKRAFTTAAGAPTATTRSSPAEIVEDLEAALEQMKLIAEDL